ncbi:MAG: hypothetical protein HY744_07980 [Deltaproteobacteria bacterium]|nr:hypothetical protein [Deltaproteobacteria bacterium]
MNRRPGMARIVALFPLLAATAALGCGPDEPARGPDSAMRVLDERRAVPIIQQAVAAERVAPAAGRDVTLAGGERLRIDVGVRDHAYGIAYITEQERITLGRALPPRQGGAEQRLRLLPAADGSIVLLLYEDSYRFDAGKAHRASVAAAELELERDVRDFIIHAQANRLP